MKRKGAHAISSQGCPQITVFLQISTSTSAPESATAYGSTHPKQDKITKAIVEHLVVGCSLRIKLVEEKHFRAFMEADDPRYKNISRSTVSKSIIPDMYGAGKLKILSLLEREEHVSITTDI